MTAITRIVLVETHPTGGRGSMRRYAELVSVALEHTSLNGSRLAVWRLPLAIPARFLRHLPGSVATWLNHLWMLISGPIRIRAARPGIVHILDGSHAYLANRLAGIPVVATVHDLIPLLHEVGSPPARALVGRALIGLRRCAGLLADSSATARDLQSLNIGPKRVKAAPLALEPGFSGLSSRVLEIQAGGLPSYVLHVGHGAAYKNREGVVRIFSAVRKGRDLRLVFVGPDPDRRLQRTILALGLDEAVTFVTEADDERLIEFYRNAAMLLFPSLYEGFGWPPLEAMACGCPVVCSSEGSLPEVVGDAALTAPAADESALARYCVSVLTDPQLAERLRERGLHHVRQFTVERMRKDLLEMYESVLLESGEISEPAARTGSAG